MKKSGLFLAFIAVYTSTFGLTTVTFTNQADMDVYSFVAGEGYNIILKNDTTLPESSQIANMQALLTITGTLDLSIEHTLLTSLDGVQNSSALSFYMEGNRLWDTLYIPDYVEYLYGFTCERTLLKRIYGADKVKLLNRVILNDNDRLQDVYLGLQLLDSTTIGLQLEVKLNDSLKTFYWGDTHHQLSQLSFFENRQLKHVHIETTKDKVYDGPLTGKGGFNFNIELDSITGFKGLIESSILQIKNNYNLHQVCVLQKAKQRNIHNNPNVESLYEIQNNGSNLQSLNDLITEDCSWLPNGIKEPTWSKLEIYPNPAHSEVFVTPPAQPTSYFIYDISGKLINQGAVSSSGRISLAAISNGMYVLMVGNKRSKLIVQ